MNNNEQIKQKCPDCGCGIGEVHVNECDVELCSACGQQRISCDCKGRHDPRKSVWTGVWPYPKEAKITEAVSVRKLAAKYREKNERWLSWFCNEEYLQEHLRRQLGDVLWSDFEEGYANGGLVQVIDSDIEYHLVVLFKRAAGGWSASDRVLLPCELEEIEEEQPEKEGGAE